MERDTKPNIQRAYLSCYYMKLLTAHTTKGKWYLFSQGVSQHGNRESWITLLVEWLFHWKKDELCFLLYCLVRGNLWFWWEPGGTGRLAPWQLWLTSMSTRVCLQLGGLQERGAHLHLTANFLSGVSSQDCYFCVANIRQIQDLKVEEGGRL